MDRVKTCSKRLNDTTNVIHVDFAARANGAVKMAKAA